MLPESNMASASIPCASDADCPNNLLCFIGNKSWSMETICHCNTYYGWSGPDCGEVLVQPDGVFLLCIGIFGVVFNSVFTSISTQNMLLLLRVAPRDKKWLMNDAVFISTMHFTVSGWLFIAYSSLLIAVPLTPFGPTTTEDKSTLYIEEVAQIILSLALMFDAFGISTVSLGFLEMTLVLSSQRKRLVTTMGTIYKLVFAILVVGLVAARQIYLAVLVAFPFIIILAAVYIIGLHMLTKKIKGYNVVTQRGSSDAALEALRAAQKSILFLCISLCCIIILGVIWCVFSFFIGWRYVTPPDKLSPSVTGAVIWLPAVLAACAVMKDISAWTRVRVARQSALTAPKPPASKPPRGDFHAASDPAQFSEIQLGDNDVQVMPVDNTSPLETKNRVMLWAGEQPKGILKQHSPRELNTKVSFDLKHVSHHEEDMSQFNSKELDDDDDDDDDDRQMAIV